MTFNPDTDREHLRRGTPPYSPHLKKGARMFRSNYHFRHDGSAPFAEYGPLRHVTPGQQATRSLEPLRVIRRAAMEWLESRQLLSTVSVYEWEYGSWYVADGVSGEWSGGDQIYPRVTPDEPALSLTVSGLPAHVRVAISFGFESGYGDYAEDTDTTSWTISDGPSGEAAFTEYYVDSTYFSEDFSHSDDELTLTMTSSNQEAGDYASPYTISVAIVTPPTISISGGGTQSEDGLPTPFTVSRSGDPSLWGQDLTVNLDTTGSTASSSDYTGLPSSVTIPAGAGSVSFDVTARWDALAEAAETLRVAVAPPAGYPVGGSPAQLVITDTAPPPQDQNYQIPVLVYHDIVSGSDRPEDITVAAFRQEMQWLRDKGFRTITLQQMADWLADPMTDLGLAADEKPFVITFDDGNRTELRAWQVLEQMKSKDGIDFNAAMSIVTSYPPEAHDPNAQQPPRDPDDPAWDNFVNVNDSPENVPGKLSWAEIRDLKTVGWEVVSHSVTHPHLGAGGTDLPTTQYANSQEALITEIYGSYDQLVGHGFDPPMAFVLPHTDTTLRNIAVAKAKPYPLVFGRATVIGTNPTHEPVRQGSDGPDKALWRVSVQKTMTQSQFATDMASMIRDQINPIAPDYRAVYRAMDGTLMIDGTEAAEQITVKEDNSIVYSGFNDGAPFEGHAPYSINPALVKIDIRVAGGNDTVTVLSALPASIDGGVGNDTINGGTGNDAVYGGLGDDCLAGGTGDDVLNGADGNDIVGGNLGADSLFGEAGADTMDGHGGDDSLEGGMGDDSMVGGIGNDYLMGNLGNDIMYGSAGNDQFVAADTSGADTMFGGADSDTLLSHDANDVDVWSEIETVI